MRGEAKLAWTSSSSDATRPSPSKLGWRSLLPRLDYPEREGGNAKRNLSRDYVTEWRTYIAEPLTIVDLCRDSAMSESELSPLRSLLKVDFVDLCRDSAKIESKLSSLRSLLHRLQREVGELRQEVAELRHAIQAIDICPHRDGCPVLDSLRKQSQGD